MMIRSQSADHSVAAIKVKSFFTFRCRPSCSSSEDRTVRRLQLKPKSESIHLKLPRSRFLEGAEWNIFDGNCDDFGFRLVLKLQLVLGLHKSNQINTFINSFGYAPTSASSSDRKMPSLFRILGQFGFGNFSLSLWSSGDRLSIKLLFSISNLSFGRGNLAIAWVPWPKSGFNLIWLRIELATRCLQCTILETGLGFLPGAN